VCTTFTSDDFFNSYYFFLSLSFPSVKDGNFHVPPSDTKFGISGKGAREALPMLPRWRKRYPLSRKYFISHIFLMQTFRREVSP
jgi:hypothetical protein